MNFNFRQITGQSKFRAWKEWKKGEFVIMKIEAFSPNKKNQNYKDITGKVLDHNFQQSDWNKEDRASLNGNTGTQKFLDACTPKIGDVIKMVFMGTETVKTGQWAGSQTHVVEGYLAGKDDEEDDSAPVADPVAEAQALLSKASNVL